MTLERVYYYDDDFPVITCEWCGWQHVPEWDCGCKPADEL